MKARATGGFASESWDELPYGETEGAPRISRVSAIESFRGDIEGRGTQELLVYYDDESSGSYVGMERVDGRLGGRSGSFVLRHSGTFSDGEVDGVWSVVDGSGTGELSGLAGDGRIVHHDRTGLASYALIYEVGSEATHAA